MKRNSWSVESRSFQKTRVSAYSKESSIYKTGHSKEFDIKVVLLFDSGAVATIQKILLKPKWQFQFLAGILISCNYFLLIGLLSCLKKLIKISCSLRWSSRWSSCRPWWSFPNNNIKGREHSIGCRRTLRNGIRITSRNSTTTSKTTARRIIATSNLTYQQSTQK